MKSFCMVARSSLKELSRWRADSAPPEGQIFFWYLEAVPCRENSKSMPTKDSREFKLMAAATYHAFPWDPIYFPTSLKFCMVLTLIDPNSQEPEMDQNPRPKRTILESLGAEIIRIITPVSFCMLLVVILVSILNTNDSSSSQSISTIAYTEDNSDSTWDKLKGALLNSLVFGSLSLLSPSSWYSSSTSGAPSSSNTT
ncbi:hypothetical protein RJ640_024929 [Escallonia rubra]|uniref:Uncharacterized protein n=1 Tax=Escallonia rubra TaxID=112253 RepID=A0AA88SKD6_9ASTE|nr:hypothetical protein RJ640_024929 [Escallonia rubra]